MNWLSSIVVKITLFLTLLVNGSTVTYTAPVVAEMGTTTPITAVEGDTPVDDAAPVTRVTVPTSTSSTTPTIILQVTVLPLINPNQSYQVVNGGAPGVSVGAPVEAPVTPQNAPTAVPSGPTVDIKANKQDGPITVEGNACFSGGKAHCANIDLEWATTGSTYPGCAIEGAGTVYGGVNPNDAIRGNVTATTTVVTLTCNTEGGKIKDSVEINLK